MGNQRPKIVENAHYHLWTDALHARSLARQARNKWDRGTYVRWTVTTAWTVLEVACQDALDDKSISYSFRKNIDSAIQRKSLAPLNWGSGLWQKVTEIQETRKNYVHRFVEESDLFPDADLADNAIAVIRNAVLSIYKHAGRVTPVWIHDNEDRGWDKGNSVGVNFRLIRAGASLNDPNAIRIYYIRENKEHLNEVLPPDVDPKPYLEDLIQHVTVPISGVRVYKGDEIIIEKTLPMRGA
jgi:hypothetical protein